ncbi:MAG: aminodeoxychorismate/anthranilate synthase component II [Planctomycetota bacterium]|jgi:anthranilate synthase component 2|nr:aminodeoxychorismate/anthranilate synthase component II [Planctomycetota bacterium]
MILIIDNYDSFTYNLVQRFGEIDANIDMRVIRNDDELPGGIESEITHLLISPGPCTPAEAGNSMQFIEQFFGKVPILGVCLGHQSIGQLSGAEIVLARELMHGKTERVFHDDRGLFAGLPNPMIATRYHSLAIRESTLSAEYEVSAWADNEDGSREIMAIRHKTEKIFGLQFHPESFLTEQGPELLKRFIETRID